MPAEIFGMIGNRLASEICTPRAPVFDRDFIRKAARAHEEGGFDRILVGYYSNAPDGFLVAAYAAAQTERIGLLLAHRPGFVAPTLAARKLATLDQMTEGRLAVHMISGGSDADQRKDGDYLSHDERYARTDEYLEILKRVWTEDGPITHRGAYYHFEGAESDIKPLQQPRLPIFFGGSSDAAIAVGARHADTYMVWGEPLADVRQTIARVREAAAREGRTVNFSVSFRPILGQTEDEAWWRAGVIHRSIVASRPAPARPQNVGSQRLLAAAARSAVHDRCLWTAIAEATGARGNTTALVGTPETVADALVDYYELGVTTFLIRGFSPLNDARQYGRELIPLIREKIARVDADRVAALGRSVEADGGPVTVTTARRASELLAVGASR
ncbi:MAG: LLM class flavin-dependent oxidoreductase [Chloroflexi bacterium]|nr:LLM class flavin-dependent oxidoreductase [Chloroflexota bacterium]